MNVETLLDNLTKSQCTCKRVFWTHNGFSKTCGECSSRSFISEKKYSLQNIWDIYKQHFIGNGYTVVGNRTVLNHEHNLQFITAGVCVYIPRFTDYGVSTHKFINKQVCIRLDDLTQLQSGRHGCSFNMLGQHVFNFKDPEIYFKQLVGFFEKLGLEKHIIYHKDTWTDGIHKGNSLQFFINGIETFNQVYTTHDVNNNILPYQYIDTGGGLERIYNILNNENKPISHLVETVYILYKAGIYSSKRGIGYNVHVLKRHIKLNKKEIYKILRPLYPHDHLLRFILFTWHTTT